MKQVWIINHYAQEPSGAGGTRHFHLAQHLVMQGWQATIIAASVESTTGRQRLTPAETERLEYVAGVPFLWVRTPQYQGNGGGRIKNMLAFSWGALRRNTTRDLPRPDVVIGSSVHPFAAVTGALIAARFGVPFVFEVRDLWPQTLVDMGRLRENSLTTWVLRKMELWLYRRAAAIIVLLPRASEYITPLGIPKERITWIPNGVDLSLFPSVTVPKAEARASFTVMYFGAHGQANSLDSLLLAMAELQQVPVSRNIKLRLVGDGPLKPALIQQAKILGLRNVSFEGAVAKKQIPSLAAEADAFVISVLDLPKLYRFGISMNKLFDYLAAGRPIVIASNAINNPVAEAGAGLTVAPAQPQALADAIEQIATMPMLERQHMGQAGREYVEQNHGFTQLAGRLAAVLNNLPSKGN